MMLNREVINVTDKSKYTNGGNDYDIIRITESFRRKN